MRIYSQSTLRKFWCRPNRGDAEDALATWFKMAQAAEWLRPADVRATFGTASIVENDRVVFNICGNKYRLVVGMAYKKQCAYIKFIGTHREYDLINAATVQGWDS